jgi:UDP-N-acetylmuramyl pentapeptide phosphotransferase/UDP-N-acetylglucosamine-1-phosphate transferase
LALLVALISSLVLTPIIAKVSLKLYIVDWPGSRRIHHKVIPRMGGLAIYSGFLISSMFFLRADQQIMALLLGGFIIALCGTLDDLMQLNPFVKLLFQICAALIVVFFGGIALTTINLPLGIHFDFGPFSIFITLIWIVGITNALNLIDGMDGLCSGVSAIILATFSMLAYMQDRFDILLLSLILLGAILGFLFFNFHPAQIFMGDTGSLFIGFMIAGISLLGFKTSAFLTLGPALFILIIPILDTLISIIRRKLKGVKIMSPDKQHLHHTLMYKMGLSQTKTVLIIYFVSFYFSQISFVYLINKKASLILLIIALIVIELFVEQTSMISPKYRPILGCKDLIFKKRR